MNYEKQMKAYLHAMKHIVGDDFQKEDVHILNIWRIVNSPLAF